MIVLMGLRGSGKSTVAGLVAGILRDGARAVDLDDVTPGLASPPAASAGELLRERGEGEFRRAELIALEHVLKSWDRGATVLALGGGTPTAPGAAEVMTRARESGQIVVVYLRARAETLRERLRAADNSNRPSLSGRGVLDEIEAVLAARDGLYRTLADCVIEVDGKSAEWVAERVVEEVG